MRTVFIADKNSKTPLAEAHRGRVTGLLREKGDVEILEIGPSDVVPCLGCLLCMTKRHGVCVSDDAVAKQNRRIGGFDLVCFFGPVVLGQYSSTMKSVAEKAQTDRMLRSRSIVALGYGDDVRDDELAAFIERTSMEPTRG